MKTFRVKVPEVHVQDWLVKAKDVKTAKLLLVMKDFNEDGDSIIMEEGTLSYSHRMDRSSWEAEELK